MKSNNKNNYIGKTLKKCIIEKDLTQEQLAELTGIAPKYLSQLERGLSKGSIDTIIDFCDFFEITPNIVLGGLFKNPTFCCLENFNINYNKLSSTNKDIVDNLVLYLLKTKKNK